MKILTMLCLLALVACAPPNTGVTNANKSNGTLPNVVDGVVVPEVPVEAIATVGNRNFDQVMATMEAVTGVEGDTGVNARFTAVKAGLPTDNAISSFEFSRQGAYTELAAEFCYALVIDPGARYATQRARVFANTNVLSTPTAVLSVAQRAVVADSILRNFWREKYTAGGANATNAQAEIVNLLGKLITGETGETMPPNNNSTTRIALQGACIAALSAAPVTLF
ncbi:MAG: hypothetical protein EOP11_03945 [Proteobacteria bacterium]|nr:MAG: hypothetical protein EOP11_03945 [Pseudomonadota bacterium]